MEIDFSIFDIRGHDEITGYFTDHASFRNVNYISHPFLHIEIRDLLNLI